MFGSDNDHGTKLQFDAKQRNDEQTSTAGCAQTSRSRSVQSNETHWTGKAYFAMLKLFLLFCSIFGM